MLPYNLLGKAREVLRIHNEVCLFIASNLQGYLGKNMHLLHALLIEVYIRGHYRCSRAKGQDGSPDRWKTKPGEEIR